jgi:hypothetical protein
MNPRNVGTGVGEDMIFDRLWRLERQRSRGLRLFRKEIRAAKTHEERECLEQDQYFELGMKDDEIQAELTRRLQDLAQKLDIPIPSGDGIWRRSDALGCRYLSGNARYDLAQQIRKEKKERRESLIGVWKDILLLLTGVAAIVSSLWSILRK